DREKLREGLAIAATVIPTKSPKPVLENIYLVASDEGLELAGTDLEVSLRYRIPDAEVEVIEPGTAVVPARVTSDFVRDLTGDRVSLETHDGNCVIESGTDRCELVTVDPDEFPVIPRFGDEKTLTMQGGQFMRLVGHTAFAAAREAGRYAMHGVLTEVEDGVLKMVATDGRRLALSSCPVESPPELPPSVIVPTKGMQLFGRGISDPLELIHLQFGENQIGMKTSNAEMFARLVDGEYPRYAAVIPASTQHSIELDAVSLTKKIRLVANVAGDEARAVKLNFSGDKLDLSGHSAGRGQAAAQMAADGGESLDAEIAFNPDYVLDGLKHSEHETLRLEFDEKTSPGKFRLGENFIYIVMPITVDV
ncbi:MAG: DNA polymerase III subunit beta, partial [Planctomycetota bacterium]